jgi:hypothetical protein
VKFCMVIDHKGVCVCVRVCERERLEICAVGR